MTSALSAAFHARSQSKTPWTDALQNVIPTDSVHKNWVPNSHAMYLENLLWEARSLLNRISEGADLVLVEDEIEAFLEKTEIS